MELVFMKKFDNRKFYNIAMILLLTVGIFGCSVENGQSQNSGQNPAMNESKYLLEKPVVEKQVVHQGKYDDETPIEYCVFEESKKISETQTLYITGDLTYFPNDQRVYNDIVVELSDKSTGEERILTPSTRLNDTGFLCDVFFQDLNPSDPDGVYELYVAPWDVDGGTFHFAMLQKISVDPENHTMNVEFIRIDPITDTDEEQPTEGLATFELDDEQ